VTVAEQIQHSPLLSASTEGIGRSYPMGATVIEGGVNFSLFSRTATGVELLLFDREDDASPSRVIPIDRVTNRSWNCAIEGPTEDSELERLRNRQVKNGLTLTLMSLGVPMILMGDEVRRTQQGNNNAYCHDDPSTWFDWSLLEKHADVHRFVSLLAARRSLRDAEHERQRVSLNAFLREANRAWHGVRVHGPDWGACSHSIALGAELRKEGTFLHFILNAYWEPLEFELPVVGGGASWRRWIDTGLDAPNDIVPWQTALAIPGNSYRAEARSVVLLYAVPSSDSIH
jgi:isoamylase